MCYRSLRESAALKYAMSIAFLLPCFQAAVMLLNCPFQMNPCLAQVDLMRYDLISIALWLGLISGLGFGILLVWYKQEKHGNKVV